MFCLVEMEVKSIAEVVVAVMRPCSFIVSSHFLALVSKL
jgi:hypothetical protein